MTKCAQPRNRLRNSIVLTLGIILFAAPLTQAGQGETRAKSKPIDLSKPLDLNDCIALALDESPLLEASRLGSGRWVLKMTDASGSDGNG